MYMTKEEAELLKEIFELVLTVPSAALKVKDKVSKSGNIAFIGTFQEALKEKRSQGALDNQNQMKLERRPNKI